MSPMLGPASVASCSQHPNTQRGRWLLLLASTLLASTACSDRQAEAGQPEREPGKGAGQSLDEAEARSETLGERDYRQVAQEGRRTSAQVKEGELVLIMGGDEDLPLLEDLANRGRQTRRHFDRDGEH